MTRRIQTLDGLPVYDATEPLFIEVVPQDVDIHRRRDPERCALAAACTRTLHVEAKAYLSRLYVKHGDHWRRYALPESVRSEVAAFDRGGGFSSGTYRLPPLPPNRRSGGPNQGGSGDRKHTGTGDKRVTHRDVKGLRSHSPLFGGATEHIDIDIEKE